jgi:hypothetical protein
MSAVLNKGIRVVLGAVLLSVTGSAIAQVPETAPKPVLRPFGSVPLMVPAGRTVAPRDCDEACLTGLVRDYMAALAKRDGANLPWADHVRYADNGVPLQINDGIWATATAHGATPLIVADAKGGKAIWMGSLDDHGQPGYLALELTARQGRIVAVETLMRRKQGRPPFSEPLEYKRDPAFTAAAIKGKETPRAVKFGLVQAYFDAQAGKGRAPAFGKNCVLIENGVTMTGNLPAAKGEAGDCASSFARGLFGEFEAVGRRIVAYDDARGLVIATGRRDLPAEKMEFTAADGKTYRAEASYPRSYGFTTAFKIEGGVIERVETIATELPYLMPPPWREPRGSRP